MEGAEEVKRGGQPTHGMSKTRIYNLWQQMMRRCYSPTAERFPDWGGRGIRVCDRWHQFENFFADMGHRPAGMSLNRIDNNGNYSPENCQWATTYEQCRNTRRSRVITHNGITLTAAEWGPRIGGNHESVRARLAAGWDEQRAVSEPLQNVGRRINMLRRKLATPPAYQPGA